LLNLPPNFDLNCYREYFTHNYSQIALKPPNFVNAVDCQSDLGNKKPPDDYLRVICLLRIVSIYTIDNIFGVYLVTTIERFRSRCSVRLIVANMDNVFSTAQGTGNNADYFSKKPTIISHVV